MNTGTLLDVGVFLIALGALLYWLLYKPERRQRERRESPKAAATRNSAWDPNIYSGRKGR